MKRVMEGGACGIDGMVYLVGKGKPIPLSPLGIYTSKDQFLGDPSFDAVIPKT